MTQGQELTVTLAGRDIGLSDLLKRVDQEMQKDANSAVRLGQAYGRLAVAQGQPAAASQILAGTMQQATGASERAIIGLETQAARLASGGSNYFQQFGRSAASSLVGIVGPAAAADVALNTLIGVGESFVHAFQFKATLDANKTAIDTSLSGIRDQGQLWNEAAQFANRYRLMQEQTTEAIQASIPVLRTSTASIGEVEAVLLRLQSKKPEKTFADAARALDELRSGQIVSIVDQFNVSREAANKMKNEIAGGADAVQVLSTYLTSAGYGMDVLENRTRGAIGAMNELKVAQENVTLAQAQLATSAGGIGITKEYATVVQGLANLLNGDLTTGYTSWGISMAANQAAQQAHAAALAAGRTEAQAAANAEQVYAQVVQQASISEGLVVAATNNHTKALGTQEAAISAASQALVDETTKKLDSAQASQQLAQFQTTLANLGGQVANGMAIAGNAAAQLASQYHVAYAEALNLINAQAALAQAKVNAQALSEQRAGERSPGTSGAAEVAAQEERRLQSLYRTLADVPKKAKAAGAARLSDQQKLQNSLLASQESYQNKSEDAADQYAADVERIYQDFYTKMREAQQDFDQERMDSSASFYDNLGSIQDQKIAQGASAAYEAASVEAGKIAQEKGADVAEKYMQAQEQIIGARAKRLADIEKAAKDKDKDKAEYLKGVDAEYKKAEDAKLARIREGEGSLTAERDKQLSDSAAKQDAAQDKIGTAAERAADRQITAADRAGKKIDENTLKATRLTATYNTVAPAAGTGQPTAAGTTPAAAAAVDPQSILSALDAIRAAVDSAAARIVGAEGNTTSAVRGLNGKFAS